MAYFKRQKAFSYLFHFSDGSINVKIEELKGFKWQVSISQVVRVHALILIIKISFPPLATMWGVHQ